MTRLFSAIFATAPFGAALIRAVQTGRDLRMLWMALGAFAATTAVVAVAKSQKATQSMFVLAGTFVVATLAAGIIGLLLGATAAPGLWAVAAVFGVSFAISGTLYTFSR